MATSVQCNNKDCEFWDDCGLCNLNDIEIEDGKCIFATNNVEDELRQEVALLRTLIETDLYCDSHFECDCCPAYYDNIEDEKNRCQRNKWMIEAGMVIGND